MFGNTWQVHCSQHYQFHGVQLQDLSRPTFQLLYMFSWSRVSVVTIGFVEAVAFSKMLPRHSTFMLWILLCIRLQFELVNHSTYMHGKMHLLTADGCTIANKASETAPDDHRLLRRSTSVAETLLLAPAADGQSAAKRGIGRSNL